MQLRATEGRVLLGGREPAPAELPADLSTALREWAEVAATVAKVGASEDQELVRRRGRLLAVRLAQHRGVPVEYVDPVTGTIEPLPSPRPLLMPTRVGPAHAKEQQEPTPWVTGLFITACFAVIVAIADVTLSRAFAEAFNLLWLPANLLVAGGLAPSLWLLRRTPFWRWVAYGITAGLVAAWFWLLIDLLGPAAGR